MSKITDYVKKISSISKNVTRNDGDISEAEEVSSDQESSPANFDEDVEEIIEQDEER
jgi:hypothetical protein